MAARTNRRRSKPTPAPPAFRLRPARPSDAELLVRHRRRMWQDIRRFRREELDAADLPYLRWMRREMRAHRLLGYIAVDADGAALGSGLLWLQPSQPRPGRLNRPYTPYILSMYTERRARRRGIATALVSRMVEWSRAHGYGRVLLHASDHGRPVYAALGFTPGREMRLDLRLRRAARARGR